MAAPTAPTLAIIVAEALKKAGHASPSSTLTTQAEGWMEEIKNDIWSRSKTLKSLQAVGTIIINKGQSRYSMPTDYAGQGEISMRLVHGGTTGSAQAGGNTSVTLASTDTSTEGYMIGKEILITSGTGVNSIAQVTAYSTTTKVATVTPAWATNPAASSGYMVIEDYYPLEQGPIWNYDMMRHPETYYRPHTYHPVGDSDYGEFYLSPCPDDTYGILVRYYVDIMTVDLAGTLMGTLYKKYRNVWLNGVVAKMFEQDDDDRASSKMREYIGSIAVMIAQESYGNTLSNLQRTCSE